MTSDNCLGFGSDRDHDGVQEFLKEIFTTAQTGQL